MDTSPRHEHDFDGLAALRASGNPVDLLPADQQRVLASLNSEEVAMLNSLRDRLLAADDAEVAGQGLNVFL